MTPDALIPARSLFYSPALTWSGVYQGRSGGPELPGGGRFRYLNTASRWCVAGQAEGYGAAGPATGGWTVPTWAEDNRVVASIIAEDRSLARQS
jgi:hypothetical protein